MLLGTLGASRHYQYEAMGDMVNTASRIQGLGKHLGAQVLASEEAVDGLRDVLMRPIEASCWPENLLLWRSSNCSAANRRRIRSRSCLGRQFAAALDAYRTRRWLEAAEHVLRDPPAVSGGWSIPLLSATLPSLSAQFAGQVVGSDCEIGSEIVGASGLALGIDAVLLLLQASVGAGKRIRPGHPIKRVTSPTRHLLARHACRHQHLDR